MAYGIVKVDNITFDNGGSDQNVTVSGLYRATTSGVTVSGTVAATTVSGVTVIGSTTVSGATVTGTTANFTSGNFSDLNSAAATVSGSLVITNQQQVRFREAAGNGVNYIALQAPASVVSDKLITLPDVTGTVVTTGDSGTVTSAMIVNDTIVNADINSAAAIVDTKLATIATAGKVSNSATTATSANTASTIVARDGSGNFTAGTITAALTGAASSNVLKAGDTMTGALVHPLGAVGTPSITFTGDLNTGIFSPGADQVAVATNGTGKLFVAAEGEVTISNATAGSQNTFSIKNTANGTDFRIVSPASGGQFLLSASAGDSVLRAEANNLCIGVGDATKNIIFGSSSAERLRITSAGFVGIGTSSPSDILSIVKADTSNSLFDSDAAITITNVNSDALNRTTNLNFNQGNDSLAQRIASIAGVYTNFSTSVAGALAFSTNNGSGSVGERMRITSTGVGIGVTSPNELLEVAGNIHLSGADRSIFNRSNNALTFGTNNAERARIDSSGRLLVGTSSARDNYFNSTVAPKLQVEGGTSGEPIISIVRNADDVFASHLLLSKTRGAGNVIVADDDTIGSVGFQGNDGTEFVIAATIEAQVDGTPGTNDMPGRLVFSTTADGAASPTERLRITSAGVLQIADAGNITVGTTTGTKIGTATTQKLGFYNATPVVQPAAVADATDAASVIARLNDLLARLRTLGIIAT